MNASSPPERPAQRLKDRFREEIVRTILTAAEEIFAPDGVHAASMAQIAERAGVAVGTLYNHFKDRDALVRALIEQRRDEMFEKIDKRRAEVAREPFRDQLSAFLSTIVDHFEEHRSFLRIVFMSEYKTGPHHADTVKKLYERLLMVIKIGHKEKILRPDPDEVYPVMLLGALRGTLMRELYGAPPISPEERVSGLCEFFLRGAGR